MNIKDLLHTRLASQQIAGTQLSTPKEIVSWMGAMQAQDYAMAKWGIGIRLPQSTDQQIEAALDKGEIIRTHILRPTWHFVSPDDIYWMLTLTAPQVKALMKFNNKQLGLTEAIYARSNKLIEKALEKNKHLTKDALMDVVQRAKIDVSDIRSSHLLVRAELDGIICNGARKDNKITYALLEERVRKPKPISREEALARLAERYFASHGPATIKDFSWWSGLNITDSRKALESVKDKLVSVVVSDETYWLSEAFMDAGKGKPAAYLLPAFDEYIISYKNRSAAIELAHEPATFTKNGIFKSTIVVNGKVTGVWKRTVVKDKVEIEPFFFKPHSKASEALIAKASKKYGMFLKKLLEVNE